MEEFIKSQYLAESGWELSEFVAAQEATEHWIEMFKQEASNGKRQAS